MSTGLAWVWAVIFTLCMQDHVNAKGIRPPKFPTAMLLDKFLEKIPAVCPREELYFIHETNINDFQPLLSFTITLKMKLKSFRPQARPKMTRRYDGRIRNGECVTSTSELQVTKQVTEKIRAIFDRPSETTAGIDRFFYFSKNPDNYIMELECAGYTKGGCRKGFFFGLYTKRAPPNQFDWRTAAKEAYDQTGLEFTDPRSLYTFRMAEECPARNYLSANRPFGACW